jgi:trehalose 6-phosphate synthase
VEPLLAGNAQVLVASNRGPWTFAASDRGLELRHAGGGLVAGLQGALAPGKCLWVCAALSDADRRAARLAPGGRLDQLPAGTLLETATLSSRPPPEAGSDEPAAAVRMLDIDPSVFLRAYNSVANSTLWFVNHHLYDTPNHPVFDARSRRDWAAYRAYDEAFADALAAEAAPGATVVVQDYHLSLTPRMLRVLRPDLRIGHFTHTPWAAPELFRVLPDDVAAEVLLGLLGADRACFLSPRWASAFAECCVDVLGARVEGSPGDLVVTVDGQQTRIGVHALGIDAEDLRRRAQAPDVHARARELREIVGDRQAVVRVDRTELSKNIVRGLLAYRELLRTRPEWQGRVVHLAFAYPSRHDLPEYREYTAAVQRLAIEIDDEFARPGWRPLHLDVRDDYPRSLAAYALADVLVVNPLRDGMNLVAKEGPILSDRGCSLVLSREAGAADELGADAHLVNPFDVSGTADALHEALSTPPRVRAERSRRLAARAAALPPRAWMGDQLAALQREREQVRS